MKKSIEKNIDEPEVTIICTFNQYNRATIYKSILDSAGIESKLLNETITSILPMQNEWTEIFLVVRAEDAAKAKKILSAKFDQEEFELEQKQAKKKSDPDL